MKNNIEIWLPVVGYELSYEVSNAGKVKSLNRKVKYKNGTICIHKSKILKPLKKMGYNYVAFSLNGKPKHFAVHLVQAVAFIPNTEQRKIINHKNGIKDDNRISNLEWSTYSENLKHAYDELGYISPRKGVNLSIETKNKIRDANLGRKKIKL